MFVYALVSLDLTAAIERAFPGTGPTRVLGIRLRGKFRVGGVVLSEPITEILESLDNSREAVHPPPERQSPGWLEVVLQVPSEDS